MNFAFSEEQEELRRAVRQFLESKSPETEVRRLMETTEGYDPAVWQQMGAQLGLQGLAILFVEIANQNRADFFVWNVGNKRCQIASKMARVKEVL